jgi:adenylate kinase
VHVECVAFADMLCNTGIKVEPTLRTGGLVPDDLMMRLISNELYKRGWLFDQGRPNVMTLSSSATAAEPIAYDNSPAMDSFITSPSMLDAHIPPQASDDPAASFILDGYPRKATQATILDSLVPINLAVSIKSPVDVILERFAGRWVHEKSGRVYNIDFNAPKVPFVDDITGEPLMQRSDDRPEVVRARLKKFDETSEPLLNHYARKGVLWEVEGLSSDEITPKLYAEFEKRFA